MRVYHFDGAIIGLFKKDEIILKFWSNVFFYATAALAAEASKIASLYSDVLSANILTAEQCKELKMGSYLGVAAASANPPHFIHLCYKPPSGPIKAKLGLVGKGLTFDR